MMFAIGLSILLLIIALGVIPFWRDGVSRRPWAQQALGAFALVGILLMLLSPLVWLSQVLP